MKRKIGDRVWMEADAGFGVREAAWATIIDWPSNQEIVRTPEDFACFRCHPGAECVEWADLQTDDGRPVYHVTECKMHDGPDWRMR